MVKRTIAFSLFFLLEGCVTGYHAVYINRDVTMTNGLTGEECVRSYSTWDGIYWVDWYPAPCSIYVKQKGEDIDKRQPKENSSGLRHRDGSN